VLELVEGREAIGELGLEVGVDVVFDDLELMFARERIHAVTPVTICSVNGTPLSRLSSISSFMRSRA
jgi:hypothetical protein